MSVAKATRQRGVTDDFYMKLVIDYLLKFKEGTRKDFEELLIEKLPEVLSIQQKKNKVKNLLQKLKQKKRIKIGEKKKWILDEI